MDVRKYSKQEMGRAIIIDYLIDNFIMRSCFRNYPLLLFGVILRIRSEGHSMYDRYGFLLLYGVEHAKNLLFSGVQVILLSMI